MDITRVRDRVMKGSVVTVPGVEKDNVLVAKQVLNSQESLTELLDNSDKG